MSFIAMWLRTFVRKDSGQDLLEYALLVALIALVAAGAVELTGGGVSTIFSSIATELTTAAGAGGATP